MKREQRTLKKRIMQVQAQIDELLTNPRFDAALNYKLTCELAALQNQLRRTQKHREIDMSPYEELRRKHSPALNEINEKYCGKQSLVCPVCGKPDAGNKLNGIPFCFKCNAKLVPKDSKIAQRLKRITVMGGKYPRNVTFKEVV